MKLILWLWCFLPFGCSIFAAPADTLWVAWCPPRINGTAPLKLISLSYDFQGPYSVSADSLATSAPSNMNLLNSQGMRFNLTAPVLVKPSLIWQIGLNYWSQNYRFKQQVLTNNFHRLISENGLQTAGISTGVFKPLGPRSFVTGLFSADRSGDYRMNHHMLMLKYFRYSLAVFVGWRAGDRLMYGFGLSRTYRIGEQSIFPVLMCNWTSSGEKWGLEATLPAKAHFRLNLKNRQYIYAGYELEGQSYRINSRSESQIGLPSGLELRRGEIRTRIIYERKIYGLLWCSIQAGYRLNNRFNVDDIHDGKDIMRGFGNRPDYLMENKLTPSFYSLISLHLVSPK